MVLNSGDDIPSPSSDFDYMTPPSVRVTNKKYFTSDSCHPMFF